MTVDIEELSVILISCNMMSKANRSIRYWTRISFCTCFNKQSSFNCCVDKDTGVTDLLELMTVIGVIIADIIIHLKTAGVR